MKKIFAIICVLAMGATMVGCSGETATSGSESTVQSDTSSTTSSTESAEGSDIDSSASAEEKYQLLQECWLGAEINFTDYRFTTDSGVSLYYVPGRYVYTVDNKVVQLREEISVADVGDSVDEIISRDTKFDKSKAVPMFYGSDSKQVTGSWDDTVSATVPNCVVEYVEWADSTETYGVVQSYLFQYGTVPVKVSGYYENPVEGEVDSTTSGAEDTTSGGAAENTTSSDATESTTESGAESAVE